MSGNCTDTKYAVTALEETVDLKAFMHIYSLKDSSQNRGSMSG